MLVIDQDFDDGGRKALAALGHRLGELPATLGHDTPHGRHLIYRTPPGWTTRAWVGKDTRNPLPAGIDLRVPGQILMAPPSHVPAPEGIARYGPVSIADAADLPHAYVAAWTPHDEPARASLRLPEVLPSRADVFASYVNARITGIVEDLVTMKPGGRNTAIYIAALRVGSTIGAARSTTRAEQAVASWTEQAAAQVLLAAAEQNGYVADHSAAEARSAVHSGLRNGFRHPRPPPGLDRRDVSGIPCVPRKKPYQELGAGTHTLSNPVGPGSDFPSEPSVGRADRDDLQPRCTGSSVVAEIREAEVD
ncbi:MAG TPA: bifunctional DNA primase/polymerase [Streptosporangiaceae bacterium]|nr:bifunctional DNA primase/polymerase [Streptosporangiaceae bacterium]